MSGTVIVVTAVIIAAGYLFLKNAPASIASSSASGAGDDSGRGGFSKMDIPADSQPTFILCTFSMLGEIAEADGKVTEDEVERVSRYIDSELKLDAKTKKLALSVFREAPESPLELRDYAEKFQKAFPERVQRIEQLVSILIGVSAADGFIDPEEDTLIRSAALLLGLSIPGYERLKEKHGPRH